MRSQNPQSVIDSVGRRIAELRVERGLTQSELADSLGQLTPQRVARMEAGANLTIHSLVLVANRFGIGVEELFRKPKRSEPPKRGRPRKKRVAK